MLFQWKNEVMKNDINMHVTMTKGASSCKVGFSHAKSGFEHYIRKN